MSAGYSLGQFAEDNDLRFVWSYSHKPKGFSVYFYGVEIVDGSILISSSGRGATAEAALAGYSKEISGKKLKIGGYSEGSRYMTAPKNMTPEV